MRLQLNINIQLHSILSVTRFEAIYNKYFNETVLGKRSDFMC